MFGVRFVVPLRHSRIIRYKLAPTFNTRVQVFGCFKLTKPIYTEMLIFKGIIYKNTAVVVFKENKSKKLCTA